MMMDKKQYETPEQWHKANRQQLKQYRGEWIASTK